MHVQQQIILSEQRERETALQRDRYQRLYEAAIERGCVPLESKTKPLPKKLLLARHLWR